MCDLKRGDEVVCVAEGRFGVTAVGSVYVVRDVFLHPLGEICLYLEGVPDRRGNLFWGHRAVRFRKALKRKIDITAWVSQPTCFEGPIRSPLKENVK